MEETVDFDLIMDELLSGDCWFETPNYSDIFYNTNPTSADSPFGFPFSEIEEISANPAANEETLTESTPSVPLKERLIHVVRSIKESQRGSDVLVQIWVPIRSGGKQFLTTCGQPFSLDTNSQSLASYRAVSTSFQFSIEENSSEIVGLPGRVFLGKVPEWTPDVRYFKSYEYPRVDHAQLCNVSGSIALPLFERDSRSCIGVLEVVLTTQKINYSSDVENICNALQAVDLRSSDVLNDPRVKVSNNSYQAALPEIQLVLKTVCNTHGLPLAQTWISCIQQGKRGTRHSNENYKKCISTIDAACYVHDPSMSRFNKACSEHHLFKGQGVVGKAFETHEPCFSPDVTSFAKTEYPLSHHAKLFNLRASVAIRLRSNHTGKADFVLEFFLPINCIKSEEHKLMLNSLSITLQKVCKSLRVVTSKEIEDDTMSDVDESCLLFDDCVFEENHKPSNENIRFLSFCSSSVGIEKNTEVQEKEESNILPFSVPLEFSKHENEEFRVSTNLDTSAKAALHQKQNKKDYLSRDPNYLRSGRAIEKRRAKSEKTISLQVLRQYFAGSLKDAALSIGVCPTTLKRICRQHGITRWPSRKIRKVGHSLKKLQVVIDSVHGAEGTFQFSSVYENFTKSIPHEKQTDNPVSSKTVQEQEVKLCSLISPSNSLSSSSFSQSSGSSLGCTSGLEQSIHAPQLVIKQEPTKLERKKSDVDLQLSSQEPSHLHTKRSGMFKVKAFYGEEKVRFRLNPSWGLRELKQEIAKQFDISNTCSMNIKYLDDESEWVLLTCDADLQECIDVYKSSTGNTIKMSVHYTARPSPSGSASS